jgi:hypothetical protein
MLVMIVQSRLVEATGLRPGLHKYLQGLKSVSLCSFNFPSLPFY